jgi:hypothetical protein
MLVQMHDQETGTTMTELEPGQTFVWKGVLWMRLELHHTSYLNKSRVFSDTMNKGDAICCRLDTGIVSVWRGNVRVEPVNIRASIAE